MAKDTRVTFDSSTSNNNNNGNHGAMSPNGMGGTVGGGPINFGHHHNSLSHQQQHHHSSFNPHKASSKVGRQSRHPERQVSTEDAENCINEFSESFPALSNKAQRLMRQVSGSFNSRTLKVALIFSIMLNIIMGISFGVFFGMWMSWGRSSPGHSGASNADISKSITIAKNSDTVPLSTFASQRTSNTVYASDAVCNQFCPARPCVKTPPSSLDTSGLPGTSSSSDCGRCKNTPQSENKSNSSAHMMLDVYNTKRGKSLIWLTQDADNICHVGKDLRYKSGKLTVLHSGQYYVYSQVTFSTIDNPMPRGQRELLLVFSIQRQPSSTKGDSRRSQTLLLSKLTMVPNKEQNDGVSGVIQLKEGDSLSVYISHPSLLKNLRQANFFGLYKL
ncbi:hypothetical protein PoB_000065700 [Plakobranchus ocellatus]|uniref:THD domain-containing protein n=1 Tax=Plakobranchus ocellatus TaxID=259542 RepID=A0AAV3XWC0_9GAST|nr:hypothetical protein PoB_000065700 [Plakobranchus ocellatus]